MHKPQLLPIMDNPDLRGSHTKFYGERPPSLHIEGYSIKEVFMTSNHKDVLRGMHFQTPGQAKIITVLTGSLIGNVLDANPESDTFGEVFHYELREESKLRLYVPGDHALGYRILEDNTRVLYFANENFHGDGDTGIDPFDPDLKLNWGKGATLETVTLSPKDVGLPSWAEYKASKGAA